jgi:Ca-activated chloride channel family protein
LKKFFAIILVLALTLNLFAGCGTGYDESSANDGGDFTWSSALDVNVSDSFGVERGQNNIEWELMPEAGEDEEGLFLPREEDPFRGEGYIPIVENTFVSPREEAAVSFTLQIDTASYRNIARFINSGNRPPADAVRVAEMVNYFNFDIAPPNFQNSPFAVYTEIGPSPFNENMHLAFVRVRAQDINREDLPANNLTFLIDTSGSMAAQNRLPLLQQSLALLVENLDARDVVSIVTYAGCAQILLDSVAGNNHAEIMAAINGLRAHGSTAGGPGITAAYELATRNFDPSMNNRIILATDGDFNVGVRTTRELEELMAEHRTRGIHMTLLGFGVGNYQSQTMETIARNGNGAYHYVDTLQSARKIFVEDLISNMYVIAEDVRAQVIFNPEAITNYRLIGYENRIIENEHFDDDSLDAGEVGVGSDIVMLFEIEINEAFRNNGGDRSELDAQLFTVRIRYHEPGSPTSRLIEASTHLNRILQNNTSDFNFAAAVASFGHILRNSEYTGNVNITRVLSLANDNRGADTHGHRREFIEIVENFLRIR